MLSTSCSLISGITTARRSIEGHRPRGLQHTKRAAALVIGHRRAGSTSSEVTIGASVEPTPSPWRALTGG